MMNIIVIIFTTINFVYLLYYLNKMIKQGNFNKIMKNVNLKQKQGNKILGKELNKIQSFIVAIITLIFGFVIAILSIALVTLAIWLPVVMGIIYTWRFGTLIFLSIMILVSILWTTMILYNKEKIHDSQEAVVRETLMLLFWFQLGFLIYFLGEGNLMRMMEFIYLNAYFFKNTFTILFPIILLSSLILNLYLYIQDLRIKFIKNSIWIVKRKDLILIFIISSFVGLLYITEIDTSFIIDVEKFNKTQDILTMLLTAILIPLIFNKINKSNNSNNIGIQDSDKDN